MSGPVRTLIRAKKDHLNLEDNALARAKQWYTQLSDALVAGHASAQHGWITIRVALPDSVWGVGFSGNSQAASLVRERFLADGWNDIAIMGDRVVEVRALATPVWITIVDGPTLPLAYPMDDKANQAPVPEDIVRVVMKDGIWCYSEWIKSYFPPSAIRSIRFGPNWGSE